jgi:hypothetical protein
MDLCDDRASGSNRCGEISTSDGIECEWEVVRAEDQNRAIEGFLLATDTGCGIDCRASKAACAHRLCGEAELIHGAWKLYRSKAWLDRQASFSICCSDERILSGFKVGCIGIQKLCPDFGIEAAHRGFCSGSST